MLEIESWMMELLDEAQTEEEFGELLDELLGFLELQDELARVRRQVAEAEISQEQLMDSVIYSTVVIDLFEVSPVVPPTFGERLSSAASGFVSFAQSFVIFIVVMLLPLLLVFVVCAVITLLIIRITNKLRRSKKLSKFLSGEKGDSEK